MLRPDLGAGHRVLRAQVFDLGDRAELEAAAAPGVSTLDLDVMARVREQTPNLHLMIPFVRTRWELEACLEAIDAHPLGSHRGLHRWVMAEVPSVVYRIPEYAALGIDGVSIGSNDLTQLMLGVDRDSEVCAELFDEADEAVLDAIGRIIKEIRGEDWVASEYDALGRLVEQRAASELGTLITMHAEIGLPIFRS